MTADTELPCTEMASLLLLERLGVFRTDPAKWKQVLGRWADAGHRWTAERMAWEYLQALANEARLLVAVEVVERAAGHNAGPEEGRA